jgi:hypothetical protein
VAGDSVERRLVHMARAEMDVEWVLVGKIIAGLVLLVVA